MISVRSAILQLKLIIIPDNGALIINWYCIQQHTHDYHQDFYMKSWWNILECILFGSIIMKDMEYDQRRK